MGMEFCEDEYEMLTFNSRDRPVKIDKLGVLCLRVFLVGSPYNFTKIEFGVYFPPF